MTTAIAKLAERFALGNASEATEILKATAFKGPATDAQMTALCVVAQQYGLNPFTRELYAFPDRNNGIVPVVGVDGWSRIINDNPQFDGMDFKRDEESTAPAPSTAKTVRTRLSSPGTWPSASATSRRGNRTRAGCCAIRR